MQSAFGEIVGNPNTAVADILGRLKEMRAWLSKLDQRALLEFERWDDFARPDGPLSTRATMPSGHVWTVSVVGPPDAALAIRDRVLYLDADGASYFRHTAGDYSRLMAEFSFSAGTDTGSGIGLISSKKPATNPPTGATGVATNSVHAVFGPDTWGVGIFDGVANRVFASSSLDALDYLPLEADKRYRAGIERLAVDRIRIHLPDGRSIDKTDKDILARTGLIRRIDDWWGSTALVEHYQPTETTPRRLAIHAMAVMGPGSGVPSGGIRSRTGWWFHPGVVPANGVVTADALYVMPVFLRQATSVDLASVNITAAVAGSSLHGVVYADDGSGFPGALLWTGAFDSAIAGAPELSAVFTAPAGLVWLGALAQGGSPSATLTHGASHLTASPQKPSNLYGGAMYAGSVTAPPPDPFPTVVASSQAVPRLSLRMV